MQRGRLVSPIARQRDRAKRGQADPDREPSVFSVGFVAPFLRCRCLCRPSCRRPSCSRLIALPSSQLHDAGHDQHRDAPLLSCGMGLVGVAFVSLGLLAFSSLAIGAAGDNWPQWRGPDGLGVSDGRAIRTSGRRTRTSRGRRRSPAADTRRRSSGATASSSRRRSRASSVPGRKAPDHLGFDLQARLPPPRQRRRRLQAHAEGAGARREAPASMLWERTAYDGLMYDDRHRKNTYASSDDGHRRQAASTRSSSRRGSTRYDFDGKLVWKKLARRHRQGRAWARARRRSCTRIC